MLSSLNGRELCRWQVYERIHGPLDNSWRDETLAAIADLIQQNTYVTGGVGQAKKNPAPKPKQTIRPYELFEKAKNEAVSTRMHDGGELILEEGEVNPFKG
jgi:hypothetical protein